MLFVYFPPENREAVSAHNIEMRYNMGYGIPVRHKQLDVLVEAGMLRRVTAHNLNHDKPCIVDITYEKLAGVPERDFFVTRPPGPSSPVPHLPKNPLTIDHQPPSRTDIAPSQGVAEAVSNSETLSEDGSLPNPDDIVDTDLPPQVTVSAPPKVAGPMNAEKPKNGNHKKTDLFKLSEVRKWSDTQVASFAIDSGVDIEKVTGRGEQIQTMIKAGRIEIDTKER